MLISEIFYSIQGEGMHTGVPSVFVRTFGCNLTCCGFSSKDADKKETFDKVNSLSEIPLKYLETGCDSKYAWHKDFRHLARKMNTLEIMEEIKKVCPETFDPITWTINGLDVHLVITGGEPLMHQAELVTLIDCLKVNYVTIETNGSYNLDLMNEAFVRVLNSRYLTISYSPKLSHSGNNNLHPQKTARDVWMCLHDLYHRKRTVVDNFNVQFKFVVRGLQEDFDVIKSYIKEFNATLGSYQYCTDIRFYAMPVGAYNNNEVAERLQKDVVNLCMYNGVSYCHRVHLNVFNNVVGS